VSSAIRFLLRLLTIAALAACTLVAAAASQPGAQPHTPPCATCIVLAMRPEQVALLPNDLHGLEILLEVNSETDIHRLLGEISHRGGRPGVLIHGFPSGTVIAQLASVPTILLDLRTSSLQFDELLFDLRTRLTALRAASQVASRLVVGPPAAMIDKLEDYSQAGYWDALVIDSGPTGSSNWRRRGPLESASVAIELSQSEAADRWLLEVPEDAATARRAIADLASAAKLLAAGLVPGSGSVLCDGRLGEVYLNPVSLERIAWLRACPATAAVAADPSPARIDRVQLASGDSIVRLTDPMSDRFSANTGVSAAKRLTVEEIVARHQAAAARQSAQVKTLVSSGTLTVTFEAPGFPAPVTVSSETTIFKEAARTDLEQREVRVNGIAFRSQRVPRLPIIEAERVSAPPLTITLGEKYRYRLEGEEMVAGERAYIVAFEPRSSREPLFRGRAWIAADDFGIARIEASETALRGAVVSSEQTDEFARTTGGAWVLQRSDVRQLYQGAAYSTPIRRVLVLAAHEVNAADFEERRQAAYASDHTILRDTPAGYRYLEGETRRRPFADPHREPGVADGSGKSSRVRTLAFGVIVDPNISQPLPFAGLSYLDFNLFGTGTQFNGFFGGTFGQLAFSVPSLAGGRWQLAGRAFGIASSYNDRDFEGGREQYDRNIRQRPAFASVWTLRPLTPRLTLRTGYELEYTQLARSEATAPDFQTPADQVAHGLRIALEGQRAGWDGVVWWTGVRRAGWRAWGRPATGDYRPEQRDFQRFGASAARSLVLSPTLIGRVETSVAGGRDLDRFSRYSFGTFENRLHGYPSALIRYDRGATLRSTMAWSPGRLVRIDGFADAAFVRDTGFARGVSRFAGVGAAIEAPAPFGTLIAAEWGYGFQGINADGGRGTHVVRITGYKVF
jgi:hypothetical protein